MFTNILVVGLGGFFGAIARFLISGWVQNLFSKSVFPFGTLSVNMLGCLVIGLLFGLSQYLGDVLTPRGKLLLITGFLGALTTFSTFGHETFELIQDNEILLAFANVGIQIVFGLFAVWIGYYLSYLISLFR